MIFGKHHIQIKPGRKIPPDIPILEWSKILAMLLEEIVQQSLNNKTHLYLSVEEENQQNPRIYYRYRCHRLRYPRQIEIVASDNFFTAKSSRGNNSS